MTTLENETILILDFGSQYTQLIARRIRELHVYCEILPYNTPAERIRERKPRGIILSGGPSSVYADNAPHPDKDIFKLGIPVLGICYGLQLIGLFFHGKVTRALKREYGRADFFIDNEKGLFTGLESPQPVWMSHGDHLESLPESFSGIGHTENAPVAAVADFDKNIFGIQFHPEVVHTPNGRRILKNFAYTICGCTGTWTTEAFIKEHVESIAAKVGDKKVVCGLSGGVDSAVTAGLIRKAIGDQLIPVFVDNGVLRKNEAPQVLNAFKDWNVRFADASDLFLEDLKGIGDPEQKRKAIGKRFISVFEQEASALGKIDFLAQGTLYPDVIESVSTWGPSATIKSHHNVGGLPETMKLQLIEPLRELFKDEVREVGKALGIPSNILMRHPFPGPGLAIRIIGEVTQERLGILREADAIFIDELKKARWYDKVWQALVVLLPVKSVGVMGDERTYENSAALRAVISKDGMTADWSHLPYDLLSKVSNRIINEVSGINRVVYDISSKPPSTIEWE